MASLRKGLVALNVGVFVHIKGVFVWPLREWLYSRIGWLRS